MKSQAGSREEKGEEWIESDECVKQMENKQHIKVKNNGENTSSVEYFLWCIYFFTLSFFFPFFLF